MRAWGWCRTDHVDCLTCGEILFSRLVGWLRSEGMDFGQKRLHLWLVDTLGDLPGSPGAEVLGHTEIRVVRLAVFDIQAAATDVRIVRGLPRIRFQAVAAHELAHVWLASRKVIGLSDWVSEGFCELVSYRFVSRFQTMAGTRETNRILANPDPVYGHGFRTMKAVSERIGFQALCAALLNGAAGLEEAANRFEASRESVARASHK